MDELEVELKTCFLDEAAQLLEEIEQSFLTLESDPQNASVLEKIFRLAHNLKGSSKAVGFNELGMFTHEFESYMLKLKRGELPVTPDSVSLLLACNDHIQKWIAAFRTDLSATVDSTALLERIQNASLAPTSAQAPADATALSEATPVQADLEPILADEFADMKAAVAELEQLVPMQVDSAERQTPASTAEVPIAPVSTHSPPIQPQSLAQAPQTPSLSQAPEAKAPTAAAPTDESIRVSLKRVESLVNTIGELVVLQGVLREQSLHQDLSLLRKTIHQLGKITKEAQDVSMSLRMVPMKPLFQKLQRIVRDTSGALSKKVRYVTEGDESELDKTVLEQLGDPLVHLVRNALDHGIEGPEARMASGKSAEGTLTLRAFHQSGRFVIEIQDDGAGINPDRLMKKAQEKGILKPGATLSKDEAIRLIFHPGFSTKTEVTEVSGRGVGMDVVRTNIEALQGDISIETEVGRGTRFTIKLPLTLAIVDGMVVTSGEQRYIIPLSHVRESVRTSDHPIQKSTSLGEVLLVRGENLPLYRLNKLLGNKRKTQEDSERIAGIIESSIGCFAAAVDDVLSQQQIVIKKLGAEMNKVKGYSGSAILGDGKPALILELSDFVQTRGAA